MPYSYTMHTVIETQGYLRAAAAAGMSDEEMAAVIDIIANDPQAGDIMPGCGGARKLRVRRPGTGKSGGYRVVTYYAGEIYPAFLLTVFPKSMKTNLTLAERNIFAAATKRLVASLEGE